MMDEAMYEQVRALVRSIPAGQVATYGDIAALARLSNPRMVGRILREDGHDIPWHRVIRATGEPAAQLRQEQLARLACEGVLVNSGRVDLRRYRWASAPTSGEQPKTESG